MAEKIGNEKVEVLTQLQTNDYDQIDEEKRKATGIDYSGAHEKTDPKERRLISCPRTTTPQDYHPGQHTNIPADFGSCTG